MRETPLRPSKSLVGGMYDVTPDEYSPKNIIETIMLEKLKPFSKHPFKLYSGQRLTDMIESIKANGVLTPIIVRELGKNEYEILAGHNRVECSKIAGLSDIKAVVMRSISDDEAYLIVTETNLSQRSLSDMSHSERASALSAHFDALKNQNKQGAFTDEIETMLKSVNIMDCDISTPMATSNDYGMSKDNIARYLKVNKLIDAHKERLDNKEISLRAAVCLSYLTEQGQKTVDEFLLSGNYRLDMKKAEIIKDLSQKKKLTFETLEDLYNGKCHKKINRLSSVNIKAKILSKYFSKEATKIEMEKTIADALDLYFSKSIEEIKLN